MKATQRDFIANAARAAKQCQLFFFCGPDEAGASAAANKIISLLDEPGEKVEISGASLKKDPVLLGDEARSGSLFGTSRHIVVRASGDEACEAVENLLQGSGQACPVLIVATSATEKSRTARLLEKRGDALVAMFWPPDLGSVTSTVRTLADTAGLQLNGDIAERIARAAGLDIRLAQSEVEKLALYLDASPQSPRSVTLDMLDAIGAKTEDDGFMPVVNAVLSGETQKLQAELQRMHEISLNPVGLMLAFELRAAQ
ncbi:MAG: DNA polymerase III subunit delta, partial [Pontixanthobacter sp.]